MRIANFPAQLSYRWNSRWWNFDLWQRAALGALVISIAARLAWTYLVPHGTNVVDLHVYLESAAALTHPGGLYSYVYAEHTPDFPLPFTYPPFAALVFYPLHFVPFGVVMLCWQLGIIAALYGVIWLSLRLIGVPAGNRGRIVMFWTAITIWIEPLRSTFDYGQINVMLVLAVLYAVYSTRWWLSGVVLGVAAGVKLTPAVAGLYFLGVRRWAEAIVAALVFFGTVGVSLLVMGQHARYYFTDLLGDVSRVGPVGTSFNQSWRGGITRIMGYDARYGPVVIAVLAVTVAIAMLAWHALGVSPCAEDFLGDNDATELSSLGRRDQLGSLLVVQLCALLVSPISWTHHWVWLVPLMVWLLHGRWRRRCGAAVLGWGWLVLTLIGVPWLLSFAQPTIWQISRPWYLAWAGMIYILATVVTLLWIAITGLPDVRRSRL